MLKQSNAYFWVYVISLSLYLSCAGPAYIIPEENSYGKAISPASIAGNIVGISDSTLFINCNKITNSAAKWQVATISYNTFIFGSNGETASFKKLIAGQYVWVWYISNNPKNLGNPPRVGAIMIYSLNPEFQPNDWEKKRTEFTALE